MKKLFILLVWTLAGASAFAQPKPGIDGFYTAIGETVPSFSFEIDPGVDVNITDFKGSLILINFFATYCIPCIAELQAAQKAVWEKNKDNPKFAYFVFGRNEGWEKLLAFKRKRGFTFPIVPDLNSVIFNSFANNEIPRSVIVDTNGKIIFQSSGYTAEDFRKLTDFIDHQLNKVAD